jgi:hypothetical protein
MQGPSRSGTRKRRGVCDQLATRSPANTLLLPKMSTLLLPQKKFKYLFSTVIPGKEIYRSTSCLYDGYMVPVHII